MPPSHIPPPVDRIGVRRWLAAAMGFLLLTALMAAAVTFSLDASAQRRKAEGWYVHTLDILLVAGQLKTAVNGALRGERGFLLTDDPKFLQPYTAGRRDMDRLVARLGELTRDNPRQQRALSDLQVRIAAYEGVLAHTIDLESHGRSREALAIVRAGVGRRHVEGVLGVIGRVEAEEHRLLVIRQAANEAANARLDLYNHVLAAVGAIFMALAAGAGVAAWRAHRGELAATVELRRLATTDELTGLSNRRYLLAQLEIEAARARRSGEPLSLAVLDIDHFKQVNDRHGHAVGDEVLRIFADVARGLVRPGDAIGRIGGEEFALVMPGADAAQASAICRRLSRAVAQSEILLTDGGATRVTLSAGVAQAMPGEPAAALIARADRALYRAKDEGRNRVRRAPSGAAAYAPADVVESA